MLYREVTPTGFRGALIGLVEGALLVGAILVGWLVLSGKPLEWPLVGSLSLAGGLVLALGRAISGRMVGAGAGCALGALFGLPIALLLPESWDIEQSPTSSFALAGPTLDGKKIDIADYRGKVVLVDFWATWCRPCIRELPHVRKAYDRYHDQGFEVIAVSLDHDRAELADYVEMHRLPWPQIIFDHPDELGGNNPLARLHHVEGIPATFLLDREGQVVARNLRGEALLIEVGQHIDPAANGKQRIGHADTPVIPVRLFAGGGCGLLLGALLGALIQRRAMVGSLSP